jgi:GNAT superfamily N-acetyltransferase
LNETKRIETAAPAGFAGSSGRTARAVRPMLSATMGRAVTLLEAEPLRHVVTLKMLAHFGALAELRLVEGDDGWALVVLLPTSAFEYDARHYGQVPHVVLVNGSSDAAKLALLGELPRGGFVLKTGDELLQRYARSHLGCEPVRSFTSFTSEAAATALSAVASRGSEGAGPDGGGEPDVVEGDVLDAAARELFAQTIYEAAELERYFAAGARWFGWRAGERLASGCFVFENFGSVWEVAGVFTEAPWRRQGLASHVVRAAVRHLLARGLHPRYQVETSNAASVELARRLGLREFIIVEHILVGDRARTA